jgi:signal transduction histidine kinase
MTRTCWTPPLSIFRNSFLSLLVSSIRRAGRAIPQVCGKTFPDGIVVLEKLQAVRDLVAQDIPDVIVLFLDRARIECVLDNLLTNALEAMPGGGAIHISAVPFEASILIEVRDTGPGIAPEIRDRLFQPFVTAPKAQGLALCLAASRQAIVEHNGQTWLQSTPD